MICFFKSRWSPLLLLFLSFHSLVLLPQAREPIIHSFLATGADTRIVSADGKVLWRYPLNTRDGWVLANGDILLAVSKGKEFPGGGVVEVTRSGKLLFQYQGTQEEVNTVQKVAPGRYLVSEAGPKPRLREIDRNGIIHVEFPIQCQLTNYHMQSRMARKISNGHYLVPQLFDKVVREYTSEGRIAWETPTPHWPFSAIRLGNGNTVISCTYGNRVIELDRRGKTVWEVTNDDLPGAPIKDACGVQRLPNGNTVITSYGAGDQPIKLFEVTPAKEIVWTFQSHDQRGIHHFQILDSNGRKLKDKLMR